MNYKELEDNASELDRQSFIMWVHVCLTLFYLFLILTVFLIALIAGGSITLALVQVLIIPPTLLFL